jgi:hypothetical protein
LNETHLTKFVRLLTILVGFSFAPLAQAHMVDQQEYNLSVTAEKSATELVETVYIPAWYLMEQVFPSGTTYVGRMDKKAENDAFVTRWMAKTNPVMVDGQVIAPVLRKLTTVPRDGSGEQSFPDFAKESAFDDAALGRLVTLRAEFIYPVKPDTRQISMRWGAFITRSFEGTSEALGTSFSFVAEDKLGIADLTPQKPEWVWKSEVGNSPRVP